MRGIAALVGGAASLRTYKALANFGNGVVETTEGTEMPPKS